MTNVDYRVQGSKLIIEIDISKEFGRSASGKTFKVASTGGFQQIKAENGHVIGLSLNVNKKATQ